MAATLLLAFLATGLQAPNPFDPPHTVASMMPPPNPNLVHEVNQDAAPHSDASGPPSAPQQEAAASSAVSTPQQAAASGLSAQPPQGQQQAVPAPASQAAAQPQQAPQQAAPAPAPASQAAAQQAAPASQAAAQPQEAPQQADPAPASQVVVQSQEAPQQAAPAPALSKSLMAERGMWPVPRPAMGGAAAAALLEAQGKCPVLQLPDEFFVYAPFFQLWPTWLFEEYKSGQTVGWMQSSVLNILPGMKTVSIYNKEGELGYRVKDTFTFMRLFARLKTIDTEDCLGKHRMSIEETIDWWRFSYTVYDANHKQIAYVASKGLIWDWSLHKCTNEPKTEDKCDLGPEIATAIHHFWQFVFSTRYIKIYDMGAYQSIVGEDGVPVLPAVLSMTTKGSTSWAIYLVLIGILVAMYLFFKSANYAHRTAMEDAKKAVADD